MFIIKEGTPADKIGENTTPETEQAIQKYLSSKGLTIRTKDQDESYIKTHTQQQIDDVTRRFATDLEKDVAEFTGIPRANNEKYYEYFKRASAEQKNNMASLNAKLAELEKKGGAGHETIIADLKKQIKDSQDLYASEKKKLEDDLTKYKTDMFNVRIENEWSNALSGVSGTFVHPGDDLQKKLQEEAIFARRVKFFNDHQAVENDGVVTFKNKDGKVLLSTVDGKPKSMADIVKELFADMEDKKRSQGGAGSGGQGGQGGQGGNGGQGAPKGQTVVVPDTVKNRVQLHDYMVKELKMDQRTREFSEAFNNAVLEKKLPLR